MFLIGLFLTCYGASPLIGWLILSEINTGTLVYEMIALVVGVVLMVLGLLRHRVRSQVSAEKNAKRERRCPHCNITVSAEDTACPICKMNLYTEERKNGKNDN